MQEGILAYLLCSLNYEADVADQRSDLWHVAVSLLKA